MPTMRRPIAGLLLLAVLSCAPGCASRTPVQSYPPVADLIVPAKPTLTAAALQSDKAANDYDAAVEAWGDGLALQVGRLCRWAVANGMRTIDCPAGPSPPRPRISGL